MSFNWIGKSDDGDSVTLKRVHDRMFVFPAYFSDKWLSENSESVRIAIAIDVETTGLDKDNDKIIEIGLRAFHFNRFTGEVVALGVSYSGFEDPGEPLSEEVKSLTGITDDMLKGQSIDWAAVNEMLSKCHVIIAHNAEFDRPFVDKHSIESRDKIWACTYRQVDWKAKGFASHKLDILSIYHGFFADAHRALNDVNAVIYLLSLLNVKDSMPYMLELINNAKKHVVRVCALYTDFKMKDLLKQRSYRWKEDDKFWFKDIDRDQCQAEIEWLEGFIYQGVFKGKVLEIQLFDRFKK